MVDHISLKSYDIAVVLKTLFSAGCKVNIPGHIGNIRQSQDCSEGVGETQLALHLFIRDQSDSVINCTVMFSESCLIGVTHCHNIYPF